MRGEHGNNSDTANGEPEIDPESGFALTDIELEVDSSDETEANGSNGNAAKVKSRSTNSSRKKNKKNRNSANSYTHSSDNAHDSHDNTHENSGRPPRRFHIAPGKGSPVDLLLMLWAFRLVRLVRSAADVRDLHLHLKGSESAKLTADRLASAWAAFRPVSQRIERDNYLPNINTHTNNTHNSPIPSTASIKPLTDNNNNHATPSSGSFFSGNRHAKTTTHRNNPQLWRALQHAFGQAYLWLGVWKLFWALFKWLACYFLLKWLVIFCQDRRSGVDPPLWKGHVLALGLLLSSIAASVCYHQLSLQSTKIGIRCRASLMVLIYRKSLKLSYVKGGVGDIVNLIANECNRVAEATVNWHSLWSSVAESISEVLHVGLNGLPALILILCIILPLQYLIAAKTSKISLLSTAHVTKRVHLVSEVLTAIKLLKFYAWESYYVEKIMSARAVEISELWVSLGLRILSYIIVFMAPAVIMVACIAAFMKWDLEHGDAGTAATMDAATVFALFSLFNTLRYPLISLPKSVRTVNAASSSLHRIEEFLNQPEIDQHETLPLPAGSNVLIDVQKADFLWDGDFDHPHINNLTLEIKRGEILAVVGDLSSGKSLLAAIMGQIKRNAGSMAVYGTCGYVPQEPWLIDANIRDNILFGLDFDDQRYTDTVRVVGLTRDLMLMSHGDETRVSDLQLSSSQRQRLSLARCIYRNSDVVLVEDCLSDFDQATARRIFNECFRNNLLKTKAIVLVTQQKQFLKDCDRILVLKNGRVIENGTFAELKAEKVNFSAWVNDYVSIDDDPQGLLEQVTEIKLDMQQGTVRGPSIVSAFSSRYGNEPADIRNPMGFRRRTAVGGAAHKPSPLGTSKVITSDIELTPSNLALSSTTVTLLSPEEANENTIKALMELNNASIQNAQINEQTLSKLIERNQLSVLTGGAARPPANFSNQDPVTRTIEANQLTVHSMVAFEKTMTDRAIVLRTDAGPWQSYVYYLNETNGVWLGSAILVFFALVHGVFFVA
ncbi:Canalicular multispecific organic anion transporter 1, partial [Physocladia obscura]